MNNKNIYKLIILGDTGVGKSTVLLNYIDKTTNINPDIYPTIGLDYRRKDLKIEQDNVILNVWDTAGQEQFSSIVQLNYRNVDGAILVYDITNRDSFEKIKTWYDGLNLYLNRDKYVIMILGNKTDKEEERKVTTEELTNLAEELQVMYFHEISALTDHSNKIDSYLEEYVKTIHTLNKINKKKSFSKLICKTKPNYNKYDSDSSDDNCDDQSASYGHYNFLNNTDKRDCYNRCCL